MKKTKLKASALVIGANVLFGLIAVLTSYTYINFESGMALCLIFAFLAVQVMFFVLRAGDKDHVAWALTMLGLETLITGAEYAILASAPNADWGRLVFYIPVMVSNVSFILPILFSFGLALRACLKRIIRNIKSDN